MHRIEHLHVCPIKKKSVAKAHESKCAALLETVFAYSTSCNVRAFTLDELTYVVNNNVKKNNADMFGVVGEMFIHANTEVLQSLLHYFNEIIRTKQIPEAWLDTHFFCCTKVEMYLTHKTRNPLQVGVYYNKFLQHNCTADITTRSITINRKTILDLEERVLVSMLYMPKELKLGYQSG